MGEGVYANLKIRCISTSPAECPAINRSFSDQTFVDVNSSGLVNRLVELTIDARRTIE